MENNSKTSWKTLIFLFVLTGAVGAGILVISRDQEIPSVEIVVEQKKENRRGSGLPRFGDYQVSEIYEGEIAEPDFSTNPDTESFITRITEGAKDGVDFGGRYALASWGCGTSCQGGAMVDAETGAIYWIPASELGREYKKDSRLLIVNPLSSIKPMASSDSQIPDWVSTRYYEWTGESFKLIREVRDYSEIFGKS